MEQETSPVPAQLAVPQTPLEIITHVRAHLLRQGKRAVNTGLGTPGECVYRDGQGPDAPRCAVGCLIPDAVYDPAIEGAGLAVIVPDAATGSWAVDMGRDVWLGLGPSPNAIALARVLNATGIPATPEVRAVLSKLQAIHDSKDPERWSELLDELERAEANPPQPDGNP